MKQQLLLLFMLLFATSTQAKNYYIAANGNDTNNGLSPASAWQSIAKVNAAFSSFEAGDSILFKRGNSFYGSILVSRSGTRELPIVISAYGSGTKPVITGFTTLKTWTDKKNGTWSSNVPAASEGLMVVTIDNNLQRMGRYPNANAKNGGWLNFELANNTALTITDNQLAGTPDWTGAEAVIRKVRWVIDRCKITAQKDNTLTYSNPTGVVNSPYPAKVGWGYFIQNDIRTLDQAGEWFLNKSTKELSVYFGPKNPQASIIKVSTADTLLNFGGAKMPSQNNITVDGIAFEGANKVAIYGRHCTNLLVTNCTLNNNYSGLDLQHITNSITAGDSITNCLNNGTNQTASSTFPSIIKNNFIKNIGLFAGMGGSGDQNYQAVRQNGKNGIVQYNRIDSVGYIGIEYGGTNTNVSYNYITNFCATKDDGGGIYTQGGLKDTGRIVSYNIVKDGIGAPLGSQNELDQTNGIYADDNSNGIYIHHNTIVNIPSSGFFGNGTSNMRVSNNNIYNVAIGIKISHSQTNQLLRNNIFTSNVIYATKSNISYWNGRLHEPAIIDIQTDMRAIGLFDSNYYRNDIPTQFDWFYHKHVVDGPGNFVDPPSVNFSSWKTFINQEAHSSLISTAPARLEFNATNKSREISLDGIYIDVSGGNYKGSITLKPYSSVILFKPIK